MTEEVAFTLGSADRGSLLGGRVLVRVSGRWWAAVELALPEPTLVVTTRGGATDVRALPNRELAPLRATPDPAPWRADYAADGAIDVDAELHLRIDGVGEFPLPRPEPRRLAAPPPPARAGEHAGSTPGDEELVPLLRAELAAAWPLLATLEQRVSALQQRLAPEGGGDPTLLGIHVRHGLAVVRELESRIGAVASSHGGRSPIAFTPMGTSPADRGPVEHRNFVALVDRVLEETRRTRTRWEALDEELSLLGTESRQVPVGPQGDAVRLLAVQLAREGKSRSATAEYLEEAFGVLVPASTLDEAFPGSAYASRPPSP